MGDKAPKDNKKSSFFDKASHLTESFSFKFGRDDKKTDQELGVDESKFTENLPLEDSSIKEESTENTGWGIGKSVSQFTDSISRKFSFGKKEETVELPTPENEYIEEQVIADEELVENTAESDKGANCGMIKDTSKLKSIFSFDFWSSDKVESEKIETDESVEEAAEEPSEIEELSTEIAKLEEIEKEESNWEFIKNKTSEFCSDVADGASNSWDYTLAKLGDAKDGTAELISSTSDSFVKFSRMVGEKYNNLEIQPSLLRLINSLDLIAFMAVLSKFKSKYKKGSKENIAILLVLGLLGIFQKWKADNKVATSKLTLNEPGSNLNLEIQGFLESVSFAYIVNSAEPVLLLIPNGNYLLMVLRLFI